MKFSRLSWSPEQVLKARAGTGNPGLQCGQKAFMDVARDFRAEEARLVAAGCWLYLIT